MWLLKKLGLTSISLVDAGASGDEEHKPSIVLKKRKSEVEMFGKKKEAIKVEKAMPEDLDEVLAKLSEEEKAIVLAALQAAAAPAEEPEELEKAEGNPEPKDEEVAKADDEEEKEMELKKQLNDERSERVKLEKRLAELESAEEQRLAIAKAKELSALPGSDDEVATVVMSLRKSKNAKAIELLEKANTIIAKSALFKSIGKRGEHEGDAQSKIVSIAKALQEDKDIPLHKAIERVRRENPDLAKEADNN